MWNLQSRCMSTLLLVNAKTLLLFKGKRTLIWHRRVQENYKFLGKTNHRTANKTNQPPTFIIFRVFRFVQMGVEGVLKNKINQSLKSFETLIRCSVKWVFAIEFGKQSSQDPSLNLGLGWNNSCLSLSDYSSRKLLVCSLHLRRLWVFLRI